MSAGKVVTAAIALLSVAFMVALIVMAFIAMDERERSAPCEVFAARDRPPARCWTYFGGRMP